MPKTLADEHIALRMFETPPADPAAITVTEWEAAIPLECRIMDYRLSPTASETLQQSEFCEGSNASVPTKSNFEGTLTVFRYLLGTGLTDAANDIAWEAIKVKGTTLFLADREGPEHDAAGAAGQEYSYYEVINDHPMVPSDRGGYIRREVTLYVQKAELNKVLVAP